MDHVGQKPLTILLAEDDEDDYLHFVNALSQTSHSYTITRAKDGIVLMQMLSEAIPDILFLDLHMPCKDGRQCISEIRADARFDQLPIIVYTTLNDLATIDHFYKAGSNFFAVKPASASDLKEILQRVLDTDWKQSFLYPPKDKFVLRSDRGISKV